MRRWQAADGGGGRTVVFSTSSDALLRIEGTLELGHVGVGIDSAQEDGFVLG